MPIECKVSWCLLYGRCLMLGKPKAVHCSVHAESRLLVYSKQMLNSRYLITCSLQQLRWKASHFVTAQTKWISVSAIKCRIVKGLFPSMGGITNSKLTLILHRYINVHFSNWMSSGSAYFLLLWLNKEIWSSTLYNSDKGALVISRSSARTRGQLFTCIRPTTSLLRPEQNRLPRTGSCCLQCYRAEKNIPALIEIYLVQHNVEWAIKGAIDLSSQPRHPASINTRIKKRICSEIN